MVWEGAVPLLFKDTQNPPGKGDTKTKLQIVCLRSRWMLIYSINPQLISSDLLIEVLKTVLTPNKNKDERMIYPITQGKISNTPTRGYL